MQTLCNRILHFWTHTPLVVNKHIISIIRTLMVDFHKHTWACFVNSACLYKKNMYTFSVYKLIFIYTFAFHLHKWHHLNVLSPVTRNFEGKRLFFLWWIPPPAPPRVFEAKNRSGRIGLKNCEQRDIFSHNVMSSINWYERIVMNVTSSFYWYEEIVSNGTISINCYERIIITWSLQPIFMKELR